MPPFFICFAEEEEEEHRRKIWWLLRDPIVTIIYLEHNSIVEPRQFYSIRRAQTPHYYNRQSFLSRPHRGIYCVKVLDVSPVCASEVHKSSKELDV
jgi:hypothetical protein